MSENQFLSPILPCQGQFWDHYEPVDAHGRIKVSAMDFFFREQLNILFAPECSIFTLAWPHF